MEFLLDSWKIEMGLACDRICDSELRYGPGRNLYNEGVADTYRKCVSELSAALKTKEHRKTAHNKRKPKQVSKIGKRTASSVR